MVSVRGASYGKGLFSYPACKLQHKPLGDAVYIKFIPHFHFWTLRYGSPSWYQPPWPTVGWHYFLLVWS